MTNSNLESLLQETEQKILNKDFYKQCTLTYEGKEYDFFIKPIGQTELIKLQNKHTRKGKIDISKLNEDVISKCIVHEDGTLYDRNLITILCNSLPAGFSNDISTLVYKISGIETNGEDIEKAQNFLAESS